MLCVSKLEHVDCSEMVLDVPVKQNQCVWMVTDAEIALFSSGS